METFHEPARDIPVFAKVDVAVAGGGPAGLAAAIVAARNGADTILVERLSFLGGVATGAPMPVLNTPIDALTGISKEIFDTLIARGGAVGERLVSFDPEMLKDLTLEMAVEAGVKVLFYTWAVAPIADGPDLKGIIIENKSGRQAILAKTVIDCTGDADLAAGMGVPIVKGRERDGKMRPVTPLFRLGNVDVRKVVEYSRQHPDEFAPDPARNVLEPQKNLVRIEGFYDTVKKGRESGELDKDCHYLRMEGVDVNKGTVFINTIRVYNIDGTAADDLSRAEVEARRQMRRLVAFIKKRIPGCENAFVIDSATSIGVRETRRIRGDYVLTGDDCHSHALFPDAIVELQRRRFQGVRHQEGHSPDAGEGDENDPGRRLVGVNQPYQIPYRCLVPSNAEGLLVAGRTISGTHEADGWFRAIYACMQMGQGAGTAAALAVQSGVTPRQLDILALRHRLAEQGVNLGATPLEAVAPVS